MTKPTRSIGIILDGNRRWAKEHGRASTEGHKEGMEALKRLAKALPHFKKTYGLEFVTLYTFSTENWNRSEQEVSYLMELFKKGFEEITAAFNEHGARVRIVGERDRFPEDLQKTFTAVEEKTEKNTDTVISFALSYGGRAEIVAAANVAIEKGEKVTEESFSKLLWTSGVSDPDIIIRTGGEQRLSNFLTWGSVYSELFFIEKYWPDFTAGDLEEIFKEYQERERRHGK